MGRIFRNKKWPGNKPVKRALKAQREAVHSIAPVHNTITALEKQLLRYKVGLEVQKNTRRPRHHLIADKELDIKIAEQQLADAKAGKLPASPRKRTVVVV